eukprot:7248048-Prymnesium_polylepis.1
MRELLMRQSVVASESSPAVGATCRSWQKMCSWEVLCSSGALAMPLRWTQPNLRHASHVVRYTHACPVRVPRPVGP